jgi:beta-lactamase class A
MGGGRFPEPIRLIVYPAAVVLLVLEANVAYASPSALGAPAPLAHAASARVSGTTPAPTQPSATATATPTPPVTTVLASSALDRLKADLTGMVAHSGARVGISLQELSGPRRVGFSVNGGQRFYAASTYKLPLLMAQAQQIASGQARPSDLLCYAPGDYEDGYFMDYAPGACFSRQALAVRVGTYSDNTAAHILVRYLGGGDALNRYARTIGMSASALWVPNTTTPDDLNAAWVTEALGRLGGAAAQGWLYPILTHTAYERGIPAGLPRGTTVVHKIGAMDATHADAAYVTSGHITYVLVISVEGLDEGAGWSLIARISGRVWQYESGRPDFVAPAVSPGVTRQPPQHRS